MVLKRKRIMISSIKCVAVAIEHTGFYAYLMRLRFKTMCTIPFYFHTATYVLSIQSFCNSCKAA